ncbi:MAG: sterol desaturase family protein [Ekhidna sp.]
MDFDPVILSIPIFFILIVIEIIYELVTKLRTYRVNDAISNISCGITSQIAGAMWGMISIGLYQYVYQNWSITEIPVTWWSTIVLFVLVDFFYYWYHRTSHEVNFMWNVTHVVHHQSEDYNLSVALRQSSFGGTLGMFFYLPLAFMGFNTYSFLAIKGFNLLYQFWIHTEAINKLPRWFEWLLNTPSHHRVHHGRNPKYIDKNHAGTLMIWDRVFGSFQAEEEKPTYGVTTPTNTWNPIWANLMPVVDMAKQLNRTPGFLNKVKVLFYKPGWQPQELGGYQTAPDIDSTYSKFDSQPHLPMVWYVFGQFFLILGFTSLFLFTQASYDLTIRWLMAGFIVWSVGQLGILMENRKRWISMEYIRIVISSTIVLFLIDYQWQSYTAASFYFLGMTLWLYQSSKR